MHFLIRNKIISKFFLWKINKSKLFSKNKYRHNRKEMHLQISFKIIKYIIKQNRRMGILKINQRVLNLKD